MALNPNIPPTSIACKKTIVLSTVDQLANWAVITETYFVPGLIVVPANPPTNPAIFITVGINKKVLKLGTNPNGDEYYLKIHFPDSVNIDKIYITYCVKDINSQDGFRDYVSGVPSTFVDTLKVWIANGIVYVTPHTVSRSLKFTAYGTTTNIPANAVTFYASFTATFGLPK